jgi:predicted DNA repair protein MutK
MATSLLALLDDIATVLDDVAVMTKVAAQRTAGVLGDDLALNAEQVSGVRAERELPVVWAVFKGSARNKLILVPVALLLAAFANFLITPVLMLGGCYLCYEGFEKIAGKFLHPGEREHEVEEFLQTLHDPGADLVAYEEQKIKGAIRTDFVLSAEIIVISMGSVQTAAFVTQIGVVISIAVIMTIGVYGIVAAIVKLDDLGIYLVEVGGEAGVKRWLGDQILAFAPYLMKGLTIVGTAAMFLVGGGILTHGLPGLEHFLESMTVPLESIDTIGGALATTASLLLNAVFGIIAGGLLVPVVMGASKLVTLFKSTDAE